MQTSVLKPGYLVALKTSVRGGIQYARTDIEADHVNDDGARVAKWQTERQITDAKEYELAQTARGKASSVVRFVCSKSNFGLLCPIAREGELAQAITDARAIADEHNRTASVTRVEVYALIGRIAQDDAEAARAISAEMRNLVDSMKDGIAAADVEQIRDAANKARSIAQMLSPDASNMITNAIREARSAAREIVKRVANSGEQAAAVVAELSTRRIDAARFAFLDMEDDTINVEREAPAARGLDLEPDDSSLDAAAPMLAAPSRNFEV